jgi:hypothetical protein
VAHNFFYSKCLLEVSIGSDIGNGNQMIVHIPPTRGKLALCVVVSVLQAFQYRLWSGFDTNYIKTKWETNI